MLCNYSVYKAFILLLKQIQYLKANLYLLFLLCILINGCNDHKKEVTNNKKQSARAKDDQPIDYASVGLENLDRPGSMSEIICQVWEYAEDAADAEDADPLSSIDFVYRGYCLFSDGSMIKDPRGNMETGKWAVNENVKPVVISFSLSNGSTETFKLAYLSPYEMKLRKEGDENIIELNSEGIRFIDPKKDPFYISNNGWRFKPAKPESDEQIKERLRDCIRFFILFYEQKINAHSNTVSFIGLPSCFKWYGGGIYLQKEKELQQKWINSYYNKGQAMQAYKLADKLLSVKYKWPEKERNWLKLNVAVLKQMESKLDSL